MSTTLKEVTKKFYWSNSLDAEKHTIEFTDLKGVKQSVTFHELSRPDVIAYIADVYAYSLLETDAEGKPAQDADGNYTRKSFEKVAKELDEKLYKWFALSTKNEQKEKFFKDLLSNAVFGVFAHMVEVMFVINHVETITATRGNWTALRDTKQALDEEEAQALPAETTAS